MRRLAPIVLVLLALALPVASNASTTVQKIPLETDVLLCNGDLLHLSGTLNEVDSLTANASGGFTVASHFNPQGISAVDELTGVRFQATGLTRDIFHSTSAGGVVETYVNRFHIQATKGAESFEVKETMHYTVTPAGSVSVTFDNFSATC